MENDRALENCCSQQELITRDDMHPMNLRNIVRFNIALHNTLKFGHSTLGLNNLGRTVF